MSPSGSSPAWFYRDIAAGDEGPDVLIVQRKIDAPMTGVFDDATAARVRGVEKRMGRKKQTGVVDAEVAGVLGEKPDAGQLPEWFTGPVAVGDEGPAVDAVRELLREPRIPVFFDRALEDAVRRYQSASGLAVTGVVDEPTALHLGDRSL